MGFGSGSPAERQRRTDRRSYSRSASATWSIAAKAVGTAKNKVGRSRVRISNTFAGSGRPGGGTVGGPPRNGEKSAVPRPDGKKSPATGKHRAARPGSRPRRPDAPPP